jgi:hypothetical protein
MKTVHNERLKITAAFLNGLAIAIFAIGGLTPAIQAGRITTLQPEHLGGTTIVVLSCAGVAVVLHLAARELLGGLIE